MVKMVKYAALIFAIIPLATFGMSCPDGMYLIDKGDAIPYILEQCGGRQAGWGKAF